MSLIRTAAAGLAAAALAAAPAAAAPHYPPPQNPGTPQAAPKGPHRTIHVCAKHRKGKGCARSIQLAVKRAKAGDRIAVPNGTYHEAVLVNGARKRYLRFVGNVRHPGKVVLDGDGRRQNGIFVNGADHVSVRGFSARDYKANGFFVTNATGYDLSHLIATHTGTYGIYAFNTIGGLMAEDRASENNDGGFYIGQTPPQAKPVRAYVRDVDSFANVIGFSGTNMRYVTITKSRFYNNGVGIVPNALDSEKYAPPEDNVITDNDVFWNNFDYFQGAPFPLRNGATGELAYPVGTGILLYGGRGNLVTNNRIFGNYLVGLGMVEAVTLNQPENKDLANNRFTGNDFGYSDLAATPGEDLNNVDIAYDGNGTGNCIADNDGVQLTVPADASTFAPCPFGGANAFSDQALNQMVNFALDGTHEQYWVKHPHRDISGITPLEHWAP